ncbi:hypothetical protein F5879DRAFT_925466 [Lentinula edodes]|nr:hypothetical protein F5879DRAFT_925466 [Lentinula edodes]
MYGNWTSLKTLKEFKAYLTVLVQTTSAPQDDELGRVSPGFCLFFASPVPILFTRNRNTLNECDYKVLVMHVMSPVLAKQEAVEYRAVAERIIGLETGSLKDFEGLSREQRCPESDEQSPMNRRRVIAEAVQIRKSRVEVNRWTPLQSRVDVSWSVIPMATAKSETCSPTSSDPDSHHRDAGEPVLGDNQEQKAKLAENTGKK